MQHRSETYKAEEAEESRTQKILINAANGDPFLGFPYQEIGSAEVNIFPNGPKQARRLA